MARDRARRKDYWKQKSCQTAIAENHTERNQLQEVGMVASPQAPVLGSQRTRVAWIVHLAVSQSNRYLTIETEIVSVAQVQSDSNRLSAKAAVGLSSSLVEKDKVCTPFEKRKPDRFTSLCRLVIVGKTARYQIGPHIGSCANLFNL